MIGAQGYYEYKNGARADSTLNASALDSIQSEKMIGEGYGKH